MAKMDKTKLEKEIYEYLKKTQLYKTSSRIKKQKRKGPVEMTGLFLF